MRIFENQMVSREGQPPNMKVENLNFDHKETLFETRAAASEWLKFKSILVSYIGNAYRIFQTLISFDQKKEKKKIRPSVPLFFIQFKSQFFKDFGKKVQNGSCWCDFYCILFSFQRPPPCTLDFDL